MKPLIYCFLTLAVGCDKPDLISNRCDLRNAIIGKPLNQKGVVSQYLQKQDKFLIFVIDDKGNRSMVLDPCNWDPTFQKDGLSIVFSGTVYEAPPYDAFGYPFTIDAMTADPK